MTANHTKPRNDKAVRPRSAPMDIDSLEGVTRILHSILGQLSSKKRRQGRAREPLRAAPQPEWNGALSEPAVPAATALALSGGIWLVRGDRYKMARGSEAQNEMDDPPEFIVLALDQAETLPMNQIRSIVERDSSAGHCVWSVLLNRLEKDGSGSRCIRLCLARHSVRRSTECDCRCRSLSSCSL